MGMVVEEVKDALNSSTEVTHVRTQLFFCLAAADGGKKCSTYLFKTVQRKRICAYFCGEIRNKISRDRVLSAIGCY